MLYLGNQSLAYCTNSTYGHFKKNQGWAHLDCHELSRKTNLLCGVETKCLYSVNVWRKQSLFHYVDSKFCVMELDTPPLTVFVYRTLDKQYILPTQSLIWYVSTGFKLDTPPLVVFICRTQTRIAAEGAAVQQKRVIWILIHTKELFPYNKSG